MSDHAVTTAPPESRRGLRRFMADHPAFVDVGVAVLYVLIMLPGLIHGLISGSDASAVRVGVGLAATIGAGLALAFRRRAPLIVLAVVIVLVLIVKTLGCGLIDPLGLAIAGYAAAAHLPPRRAWITVPSAIALVVATIAVGGPLSAPALSVESLLVLTLVLFVPACLLGLLVGTLARLRQAEELRVGLELQEKVQAAELAAVQQRTALSREMHDVVGHSLTAIINLSDGALRASTSAPETLEAGLRRINRIARDALGETRTILATLRLDGEAAPRTPAQPRDASDQVASTSTASTGALEDGIRELLRTAESTGLPTSLTVSGEPGPHALADEVRGAVYRIVQEAITNAMRHADGATQLAVSLVYSRQSLTVQVHDNGHVDPGPVRPGNGLSGAAERAALVGGELHAGPAPSGGWHVTVTVPESQEGGQ